jgi:hypothetical protein
VRIALTPHNPAWTTARLSALVDEEGMFDERTVLARAVALWSPSVNAALATSQSRVRMSGAYRHPAGDTFVAAVAELRGREQHLFDAPKVRLAVDPSADGLAAGRPILLQDTTYFQTVASNDLTGVQVRADNPPRQRYDGFSWFCDGNRMRPLGMTATSDQLGVQTIAVTEDDRLLITRQGTRSAQSAGLWAPSGSGSLDRGDVRDGEMLHELATGGMERELIEECGLRADRLETVLTGFARLVHRGGKPELFGFTRFTGRADSAMVGAGELGLTDEIRALPASREPAALAGDLERYAAELDNQSILLHLVLLFAARALREGLVPR